jgi:hypothetical protein
MNGTDEKRKRQRKGKEWKGKKRKEKERQRKTYNTHACMGTHVTENMGAFRITDVISEGSDLAERFERNLD